MTGRKQILAILALTAGSLIMAPLGTAAAPVRGDHGLNWQSPGSGSPKQLRFSKGGAGTENLYSGENGYLGLNDMLVDPNGRPPRNQPGSLKPNSPATMLPVPLPATLPLLLGGSP